ncbi:MAG: SHOCT domain-containing protein [Patescibacteria group bacterium]
MGPIEGVFILFGWIIFVVFVIVVVRFVVRSPMSKGRLHDHMFGTNIQDPSEIVKLRYAKGEITKEEYLDILKTLGK